MFCFSYNCIIYYLFLLFGDKFMPEMHLRQPGFTYSACGRFTKTKERIQKLCLDMFTKMN